MKEIWKKIKKYENIYSISNKGRVRRELNKTCAKKGNILKPFRNIHGYLQVSLFSNGKRTVPTIHSLVIIHFVGDRKRLMTINHKDGNKGNNNLDNLEYMTYSENIKHAFRTGIRKTKITIEQAREIREKYSKGDITQKDLSVEYGIASPNICLIINNKKRIENVT